MCGFAGMFHKDPKDNDETLLMNMSKAIRHRGPDDSQYIVKDGFCVAFAAFPLSIWITEASLTLRLTGVIPPFLTGRFITILSFGRRWRKRESLFTPTRRSR